MIITYQNIFKRTIGLPPLKPEDAGHVDRGSSSLNEVLTHSIQIQIFKKQKTGEQPLQG